MLEALMIMLGLGLAATVGLALLIGLALPLAVLALKVAFVLFLGYVILRIFWPEKADRVRERLAGEQGSRRHVS